MTAFLICCCVKGHIKIRIHSLIWDNVPYCDNKTGSPLFPIYSFATLSVGHMDNAKAEIKNNEAWVHVLDIYHRNKKFTVYFS